MGMGTHTHANASRVGRTNRPVAVEHFRRGLCNSPELQIAIYIYLFSGTVYRRSTDIIIIIMKVDILGLFIIELNGLHLKWHPGPGFVRHCALSLPYSRPDITFRY